MSIDKAEYDNHPAAYLCGLTESDNSTAQIDIRSLRVEFFYFPEYRNLSPEEQRSARRKYLDVCDQIMYNLVLLKEPMSAEDIKNIESSVEYDEPPYVTIRRLRETNDRLEIQIAQLHRQIQKLGVTEQELTHIKSSVISLVEGPIRLVEWRKYSWSGLGRLTTRAFFGFDVS